MGLIPICLFIRSRTRDEQYRDLPEPDRTLGSCLRVNASKEQVNSGHRNLKIPFQFYFTQKGKKFRVLKGAH